MFDNFGHQSHATINPEQPQITPGTDEVHMGADQLMDELFSDLDLGQSSTVVDGQSLSKIHSAAEASVDAALVPQSRQPENDDLWVSYAPLNRSLGLSGGDYGLVPLQPEQKSPFNARHRLLISCGYISLVGLTMFWVGRQLRMQQTAATPVAVTNVASLPAVAPVEIKPADIEFAQYISKSIQEIAKASKTAPLAPVSPPSQPNTGPGTTPTTSPTSSTGLPTTPKVGSTNPQTAQRTKTQPVARAGITPQLQAKPGQRTKTTGIIATARAKPASAKIPAPKPVPLSAGKGGERKFLGGMNLGAQPVFMVSVNGTARQFKLNEVIDDTGAAFIEFDGEQSILKQGSQLRSVTAGQQF